MSATRKPSDPIQPRRPRGRPKAEDLAALEARLLTVGRQLFFRLGYGATTMSDVAKAARCSKTTLYSRFTSKEALFRAILSEQVARWDSGVHHTPMPAFDSIEEVLLAYGDVVLRAGLTTDFVQVNRLLNSESGRFPELAAIADARFRLGVDYLAGEIRGAAEREQRPCPDPDSVAELFLTLTHGWCAILILGDRIPSAEVRQTWLANAVRNLLGGRASW
jgi:TetR/AcrR family transcriptional repressor of mexJK operon